MRLTIRTTPTIAAIVTAESRTARCGFKVKIVELMLLLVELHAEEESNMRRILEVEG